MGKRTLLTISATFLILAILWPYIVERIPKDLCPHFAGEKATTNETAVSSEQQVNSAADLETAASSEQQVDSVADLEITAEELRKYDGSDPSLPIYLSVNGDIFDVTAGKKNYGPGGGYSLFAGRICDRALAVSEIGEDQLNDDLMGLNEGQMTSLKQWTQFFDKKYTKVGKLKKL
mmetsp:Transcript_27200/g.48093  ORF Transcript_27200/g.48093 Transcript_27200/m.48093 type:complete len:176 (+) Transcript_27200:108-635(+)|eukprot:CAMPEP_0197526600 /NCGR_PEP_ID=MMETSP1318-20131121/18395_1 /TAXON_ID=552666 /ORGANISM="Partenskyella glossopodia, Strain RCC365" /LENGTH=175 /DNA_ID=CAMNT_0043080829 /DNA_START=53 /DNA_END=583 /DNA_ORIENTATION=+